MSTKITYKIPEKKEITLGELSPGQVFYYADDPSKSLYLVTNEEDYPGSTNVVSLLTGSSVYADSTQVVQVVNLDITVELANA